MNQSIPWLPATVFFLVAATTAITYAQKPQPTSPAKEPKMGPSNSTELGIVFATGNAKSTSAGFRNVYIYRWPIAELGWETGWLRATSLEGDRYAVEQGTGFAVVDPESVVDSERLFSKLRYQRQLYSRLDWFSNFDAARDEPANISRQHLPALETLNLRRADGVVVGSVEVPKKQVDTNLTTSLVITF